MSSKSYTANSFNLNCKENGNNGDFFLLHQNIRSFNKNYDEFNAFCLQLEQTPDVLIFTETWGSDSCCNDLEGYRSYHVYRTDRSGGGVSVYVKSAIKSHQIENLSLCHDSYEFNVVNIVISPQCTIKLFAIYRPPDKSTIPQFIDKLSDMLASTTANDHVFLIGDFNIDLASTLSSEVDFASFCLSETLIPLITTPTRVTQNSSTTIDHIWTNQFYPIISGTFEIDVTDHYPTFALLPIIPNKNNKFMKKFRDHSQTNIQKFTDEVQQYITADLLPAHADVNHKMDTLSMKLMSIYNKNCPVRSKEISLKTLTKPWMNEHLLLMVNQKHELFRDYKSGTKSFHQYNTHKNACTSALRVAKKNYYHNKFESCSGNAGGAWKVLNSLIGKKRTYKDISLSTPNQELTSPVDVANEFNKYFTNIGTTLDGEIPPGNVSPLHYMSHQSIESFFASPTCGDEIIKLINNMESKSTVLTALPIFLFKIIAHQIAPILATIFNESLVEGVFPDCLKIARVIPIFKAGNSKLTKNYRPISMLPFVSKIFEKLMCTRVNDYLNSRRILSKRQFGFIKNSSTSDALLEFIDNILESLDNKHSIIAVFLDFSKAFDTVNHAILLKKMYHLGFRGSIYNWFKSYLSNRKQFVSIKEDISVMCDIKMGVPQGSVLGPLLFLIYINDMSQSSSNLKFIHFADDTTVFASGQNLDEVAEVVNAELTKIDEWLKSNRLSLNVDKTNYMIISNSQSQPSIDLQIRGKSIKKVNNVKFLGVVLDDRLDFKLNTNAVINKISRSIGVMRRVRHLLPEEILLNLYYTTIYVHVIYGILAWGNSSIGNVNRLKAAQNRAIKLFPQNSIKKDSILSFESVYEYCLACKMFSVLMLNEHEYFKNKFLQLFPSHEYSTRHQIDNKFNLPAVNLTLTQKSFAYQAILQWNKLPEEMKISYSKPIFKKKMKNHLLSLNNK